MEIAPNGQRSAASDAERAQFNETSTDQSDGPSRVGCNALLGVNIYTRSFSGFELIRCIF